MESTNSATPYSPIPYPWQQPLWQSFIAQFEQERLPHALLLAGQKDIGKWHYANVIADFLLCSFPKSGLACRQCKSCQLIQSETHPDKILVIPEEPGKLIKVDQIRQLATRISNTAQQGGRKVVILGPVEQLNINSANALLKNLEEPSDDSFFILYSHVMSGVIATIRSRCQLLSLPTPNRDLVVQWLRDLGFGSDKKAEVEHNKEKNNELYEVLNLAGHAPLLAKSLLDNNDTTKHLQSFYDGLLSLQQTQQAGHQYVDIEVAKVWLDLELTDVLGWWIQLLQKLLSEPYKGSINSVASSYGFIDSIIQLQRGCDKLNKQWLFKFMDKLLTLKKQLLQGTNPNKQLLLEELLMDWCAIIKIHN